MIFSLHNILILFAAFSAFNIGLINLLRSVKLGQLPWLSLGVILFSICLFGSFAELTGAVLQYPLFIWVHVPFWYLVGPLVFLHAKGKLRWYDLFHLLPALYYFLRILPFYELTNTEKLLYYNHLFDPVHYEPDLRHYANLLSIGLYALLGYFVIKKRFRFFEEYETDASVQHKGNRIQWLYLILGGVSLFSFLVSLVMDYSFNYFIQFDYVSLTILAVLIILLQTYFTYNGLRFSYTEKAVNKHTTAQRVSDNGKTTDYAALIFRLDEMMEREKLYRKPDIKIGEVADSLDVTLHQLSAAINHHHQNNFFDYINRLRVEELKSALTDPANDHLTLFAIANAAGFNSSSSFYRVFKKYTGQTPKQFIEQSKKETNG